LADRDLIYCNKLYGNSPMKVFHHQPRLYRAVLLLFSQWLRDALRTTARDDICGARRSSTS
jgi:hypothetical protein